MVNFLNTKNSNDFNEKLEKSTVTNAENKMLVQKFEKKTWKKLMKTKKIFKTTDNEKKVNKEA